MLIRFIAKNIYSFKEITEFNLLTSSKTKTLPHHKTTKSGIDLLRFGAIYGANGAGKSNLIKSVELLQKIVKKGEVLLSYDFFKFKLLETAKDEPISLAIEFIANGEIYYYSLSFHKGVIHYETLFHNDSVIFSRETKDSKTRIQFTGKYLATDEGQLFLKILEDKLIDEKSLVLSFLGKKYNDEFSVISDVYNWFTKKILIISSLDVLDIALLTHCLVDDRNIEVFTNSFIKKFDLGIESLSLETIPFEVFFKEEKNLEALKDNYKTELKDSPFPYVSLDNSKGVIIIEENDNLFIKSLVLKHSNLDDKVSFILDEESDGTVKLIQYILPLYFLINSNITIVIDEIEKSLHPKLIKELLSAFSEYPKIKGQLIFTTHESNLLDQKLLRPDEVWFVEKDKAGASKFYPLSDFKVHNTINIEKGYLEGRFGAIPFLGNLDLLK